MTLGLLEKKVINLLKDRTYTKKELFDILEKQEHHRQSVGRAVITLKKKNYVYEDIHTKKIELIKDEEGKSLSQDKTDYELNEYEQLLLDYLLEKREKMIDEAAQEINKSHEKHSVSKNTLEEIRAVQDNVEGSREYALKTYMDMRIKREMSEEEKENIERMLLITKEEKKAVEKTLRDNRQAIQRKRTIQRQQKSVY